MTYPTVTEFQRKFVEGWAQVLHAAGIGVTWRGDGTAYAGGEIGIGLMAFPDIAGTAVALTPYILAQDPVYADTVIGLQVKTRTPGQDPRDGWAVQDAVSAVILGTYPRDLPTGIHLNVVEFASSTPMGRDGSHRWFDASNYRCHTYRPSPSRI